MLTMILFAAAGGALIVWGVVLKDKAEDKDGYMRRLSKNGFDPAKFENAYLAYQDGCKFNSRLSIGVGIFLIVAVMYNLL